MFTNKTSEATNGLIQHASHSADAALHATQRVANEAMVGLSHSLQTAGHQVSEGVHHASDRTVAYIRDEPVKAVLIAAATGAALVALARVIAQPRHLR